jgi:hypothetical protein
MSLNVLPKITGVALAIMAAGLASGASAAGKTASKTAMAPAESVQLVHCSGVNSCKGHNDCKTANNACKGQGSCKGTGFAAVPEAACTSLGGKVIDPGMTTKVSSSDLVHCMGVNSCKGHNDCKTANNACKGQGSCKGLGFIALPAAACSNVGGTAG